jgi:3-(3-hydroxy-phenyl)propionate hydroxylase
VHQVAWKLADVLAGRADDALLDTYRGEREPHARALIRMAQLVGGLMTRGGRAGAAVRQGVLPLVRRMPAVAALATSGHTPPLGRGPLVERRGPAGRRLAGTLLPQPTVLVDGLRSRLDDVLGAGAAEIATAGGGRVRVTTTDGELVVTSPDLARWMRTAGAASVVVRPDRIVRSAHPAG